MLRRQVLFAAAAVLSAGLAGLGWNTARAAVPGHLPSRLGDQEFWALVTELSEPGGSFRSDNLLSNESRLQLVIPDLLKTVKPGGVYVGVGPEQNFTYIAALQPSMAFIVDIRRGNLQLHLMYKALFELSADRADFVSRLFSRQEPDGLRASSTPSEIFDAYATSIQARPLREESESDRNAPRQPSRVRACRTTTSRGSRTCTTRSMPSAPGSTTRPRKTAPAAPATGQPTPTSWWPPMEPDTRAAISPARTLSRS